MLKKTGKLIYITLVGLTCLFAFNRIALAASCLSYGGSYTFAGTLKYQRDDASTGIPSNKFNSQGAVWGMNCSSDSWQDRDVYWTLTVNSAPVPGYTDVYPTNVDGLGVRYNFALNSGDSSFCAVAFDDHIANSTRTYICHLSANASPRFSLGASLQFIKTKANISAKPVTSIPAVTSFYRLNNDGGLWDLENIWTGIGSVAVSIMSCSINTSRVDVALAPIFANSFTGPGTTRGDKSFTIGLQCDAGARINVSLGGPQNADTSNTSILALTNSGSAGVATGVGIQLLYGGTPLNLNQNIVLKTSAGGQEFPPDAFTARYYQTKSSVTSGEANATATLNLTYQ